MVMQVLVIAVQNAADYRDLGAATSGVTFSRAIGSVFGVALFGAIFANHLDDQLRGVLAGQALPPGLDIHALAAQPAAIAALPEALRSSLAHAYTMALQSVFLAAVPFALVAFALTWRLKEMSLRETTHVTGAGEGLALPAHTRSSDEIERLLSRLVSREGRRQVYEQLAAQARVDLPAVGCWLLFRLEELQPATVTRLVHYLSVSKSVIDQRLMGLVQRGLVRIDPTAAVGDDRAIMLTE